MYIRSLGIISTNGELRDSTFQRMKKKTINFQETPSKTSVTITQSSCRLVLQSTLHELREALY